MDTLFFGSGLFKNNSSGNGDGGIICGIVFNNIAATTIEVIAGTMTEEE